MELFYFNGRGLGEIPRLVLAEAKAEYKDTRVADWPRLKPQMPFGQMPVLHDGDLVLAQSQAIVRYLADKFNLAGATPQERALADSFYAGVWDLRAHAREAYNAKEDKEAKVKAFLGETLPTWLGYLRNFIKQHGGEWVVGKGVTYADLVLFNELSELRRREGVEAVVKTFPELIQHSDRVAARPNIAQWLAKRPQTEW